jgi:hypothetical protein
MADLISPFARITTVIAVCILISLSGCAPAAEDSASAPSPPAYDPHCVIKSSTMGCIDQTTYQEVIRAQQARDDASSPDEGEPPGLHGP